MSPIVTAALVTGAVATALIPVAAWLLFRYIPSMEVPFMTDQPTAGRHRLDAHPDGYRPRSAAEPVTVRNGVVQTLDQDYDEAKREDWARGRVAAAGKSWETHTAKFSGAVLPRPKLLTPEDRTFLEGVAAQPLVDGPDPFAEPTPATPDDWFGVPADDTRQLDAVQ